MGLVYVISDLHLGHKNMATRWRNFNDEYEQDAHIVKQWNEVVNKKDVVWILGDLTMESSKHYYVLDQLKGIKKVILGNHEKPSHIQELLKYVNCVRGTMKYKGAWFSHIPMHPVELHDKVNIHGHVHQHSLKDKRYINVSAEVVNYRPQLIDKLLGLNKDKW